MRTPLLRCVALPAALVFIACTSDEPDRTDSSNRGTLGVEIAALGLDSIEAACWRVTVENGATPAQTVWTQTLSSTRYGDGAGSVSYVGTCDASPTADANSVSLELLGIYTGPVADCDAAGPGEEFQDPGVLTQAVTCRDNEDALVAFNVAVLRPARQGFFDIAVNFGDIFCSAKVDCCKADVANTACESDIMLLHDSKGERASTLVVGFACAAGDATTDTFLYMDDLTIVCDDGAGGAETTIATITPHGAGNLCDTATDTCVGVTDAADVLYQVGVYRGKESLSAVDKVYWDLALGVNKARFPSGQDCYLRFAATADDDNEDGTSPGQLAGAQGGTVAAGDVYPIIDFDVLLSDDAGGAWACTGVGLNDGGGVSTTYTTTTGGPTTLAHCYDPEGGCGSTACVPDCANTCGDDGCGGVCACAAGSLCDPATAACLPCVGYTADFDADPTTLGWVLLDNDGNDAGTASVTPRWVPSSPSDADGFVRLTDEQPDENGALYHPTEVIPAGDASIGFAFRVTSTNGDVRADGLAFTIVQLASGATLSDVLAGTFPGAGLGYHNPAALADGHVLSAVTVELDTFYNIVDPTTASAPIHLAVHTSLNAFGAPNSSNPFPGGLVDYVALPGIADGEWHQVRVDLVGSDLEIYVDGALLLSSSPGIAFEGGHMFFSSSTGTVHDAHDIDQIEILAACSDGQ